MKKLAVLIFIALLYLMPSDALAAVSLSNSTTCVQSAGGTSLSCSVTNTSGNLMVVVLSNRLNTGGCSTTDIDNLAATYNGVAMSFQKGSSANGVAGPAGTCVFGHVLSLASPATGSNTLSITWTGTARVAASVKTFAGATGGIGTISESNTTGDNWSLSPTITSDDMVMGGLVIADSTANFSLGQSNVIEVSATNFTGTSANNNTGTGTVTVSGSVSASQGYIFWAIPILGAAPVIPRANSQSILWFE